MVGPDSTNIPQTRSRGRRADSSSLTARLEALTRHPNDDLANAALAVLRQITNDPQLVSAQRFHEVYLEMLRQGRTLSYEHRRREWRAVCGLGVGVYHALIRRLRDDVRRQHGKSRRPVTRVPKEPHLVSSGAAE